MTVTQALYVVHGLVSNMMVVMDSTQSFAEFSLNLCSLLIALDGKASMDSIRDALGLSIPSVEKTLFALTWGSSDNASDGKRSE